MSEKKQYYSVVSERIGEVLHLRAPAKVNLSLHILGRRDDGYHNLVTRMQKISLYDDIDLTLTGETGIHFSCNDSSLPNDGTNLVVRAAETYKKASNRLQGIGINLSLHKNIPIAAGLGGGSSDAGTVLLGLNELCGDEFSEEELLEMATPLGADVPFFASNKNSVQAEGIGEILYPVESASEFVFILVNPGFSVSTKEIFTKFSLTTRKKRSMLTRPTSERKQQLLIKDMHNDLEKVTCLVYPQLHELKERLISLGAVYAMMSGSGPTCFGLFEDGISVKRCNCIREILSSEYGSKIFVAKAI